MVTVFIVASFACAVVAVLAGRQIAIEFDDRYHGAPSGDWLTWTGVAAFVSAFLCGFLAVIVLISEP